MRVRKLTPALYEREQRRNWDGKMRGLRYDKLTAIEVTLKRDQPFTHMTRHENEWKEVISEIESA